MREGLAPLMRWLKRLVDRVLARVLGLPGLELAWQDTVEQDPGTLAGIAVALVGAGITTRNEARRTLGLKPLPGGDTLTSATPLNPVTPEPLAKADGDDWQPDEHPRQPEGAPDGKGGEFAPKSGGAEPGADVREAPPVATLPTAQQAAPSDPAAARAAQIAALRQRAANCNGSQQCYDSVVEEARRLGLLQGPDMEECLKQFVEASIAGGAAVYAAVEAALAISDTTAAGAFRQLFQSLLEDEGGSVPRPSPPKIGPDGQFDITDWTGFPEGGPKPSGPFRLLPEEEYGPARAEGNAANRRLNNAEPDAPDDTELHHIKPIKFGGEPNDPDNIVRLQEDFHHEITTWWKWLQRQIERPDK